MQNFLPRPDRRRSRGFSLIELMVGLVLGMIAVIVIMQVFGLAERGKRTTTGGDDALTNGAIALGQLQRDARQSGQGLGGRALLTCTLQLPGARQLSGLGPTTINHASIPAGDAGSDTLLVVYGNGNGSPEGDRIISQPSAGSYSVATPTAFLRQDYVIAALQAPAAPCALVLDRVSAAPAGNIVTVATGIAGTADTLFNWGRAPHVLAYAVRGGQLTQCDFMTSDCSNASAANWPAIIDGVVGLRAQYLNGAAFNQTTPTTACAWSTLSALRMALTTRSGQLEKTDVTAQAPTWAGSSTAPIVLSGNSSWKRYRYRVFESVVPMRNVAWQGSLC